MTPITFEWLDDDQTIVHVFYPRQWAWDEYHNNLNRLTETIVDANKTIYIINEYEEGSHLPTGSPISHYRRSNRTLNIGFITYVTTNNTLKAMLRAFLNGIQFNEGVQYIFVGNVEDALTAIHERQAGA